MGTRFQYEALGAFHKVVLRIASPLNWRAKSGPWIFDKQTGTTLQLADDEDAVLVRLRDRSDATFDLAAQAVMDKRRGYVSSWHRIACAASASRESAPSARDR